MVFPFYSHSDREKISKAFYPNKMSVYIYGEYASVLQNFDRSCLIIPIRSITGSIAVAILPLARYHSPLSLTYLVTLTSWQLAAPTVVTSVSIEQ
jgi:hypothetical protein